MKLAIVDKEKCKPLVCGNECKKYCPVEKKELDRCVVIGAKCVIDEHTCVGCSICVKRCPFGALSVVNLPSVSERDIVHRYGENGFALYGLPVPKSGKVLGLLGRNGIGKSTVVKILAGTESMNLGKKNVCASDVKEFFKGNEILRYFDSLKDKKVSYKPQNLSDLAVDIGVLDLLKKRGDEKRIRELAELLGVSQVLGNRMDKLSGGELQRVAILAASLGESASSDKAKEGHIYFFDEPLAFLDIGERIRVSDFLRELSKDKTLIVVEHDLLILDYLTDYVNVFYGGQGAFGIVSGVKASKVGVNAYLEGFLKEENMKIRDKALSFNFTKNAAVSGVKVASWPDFGVEFESGFKLDVMKGEIRENHVIGILGKNGTGKTTFVKALAGELETSEGKLDLKLDVSYKKQYLEGKSDDLVRGVCFKEKINKRMKSVFNLGVLESKRVCDLSGGELQRFEVARCLARDADVYLIDEPSAYLDVEGRISVAKAIKDLMIEKGKTAFVVDHDLLVVSYLADSVINFDGEGGIRGKSSEIREFEEGVGELLKGLDVTLRKDKESGRPRINKRGSVLDREQKAKGKYAIF